MATPKSSLWLGLVPIRWLTYHTEYEKPYLFVGRQKVRLVQS
ncbi:MAG: hypothetical protein ACTMUB_04985 [cyanobacterium endosymbiont of Rhopalodia musculus]|nr:hypothetical protein [cyanobacterium endosymbiont of Epithemia clementina EcSB]WGT67510.1 hypothetical protein P3F56_10070 [cyanobacterium endosymbiont of Epithemia clementina EcSB]